MNISLALSDTCSTDIASAIADLAASTATVPVSSGDMPVAKAFLAASLAENIPTSLGNIFLTCSSTTSLSIPAPIAPIFAAMNDSSIVSPLDIHFSPINLQVTVPAM